MSKFAKPQSAPTHAGNLEIVCTICVEALVEHKGDDLTVTKCGHPYHLSCLEEWLQRAFPSNYPSTLWTGECPVCSTTIWMSDCRPLFLTAETKLYQTVTLEEYNKLKVDHYKLHKEHSKCAPKVSKTVAAAKPCRASSTTVPSPSTASARRVTRSVTQKQRLEPVMPPKATTSRSAKMTVSKPPKPSGPVPGSSTQTKKSVADPKPSGPPKPNPSTVRIRLVSANPIKSSSGPVPGPSKKSVADPKPLEPPKKVTKVLLRIPKNPVKTSTQPLDPGSSMQTKTRSLAQAPNPSSSSSSSTTNSRITRRSCNIRDMMNDIHFHSC